MDSSDIWWLVLGSVIGAITHALLHCIGSIVSKTTQFIQQITFQYLAKHFDLSAHTFSKMSNGAIIPRLLEQIGLRTYEYMWLHEANASANDSVQHGYIRLPSKSAVWKLLAFCHISHYIWISSDLQTVHIVGPTPMVLTLVKMSNQAATRRMNESEISVLKEAFGCDGFITDLDRSFWKCERYTLIALTIIAVIFTCIVRQLLLILISLLLFFCTLCHSWSVLAEATRPGQVLELTVVTMGGNQYVLYIRNTSTVARLRHRVRKLTGILGSFDIIHHTMGAVFGFDKDFGTPENAILRRTQLRNLGIRDGSVITTVTRPPSLDSDGDEVLALVSSESEAEQPPRRPRR